FQNIHQLIKRTRVARPEIVDSAGLGGERANAAFDGVLHVYKIALLLAMFENSRSSSRFHLFREMINHARWDALVSFARSVNVEVTQTDDDPVRGLVCFADGDIVHDYF